jgi:hypothetical protein
VDDHLKNLAADLERINELEQSPTLVQPLPQHRLPGKMLKIMLENNLFAQNTMIPRPNIRKTMRRRL